MVYRHVPATLAAAERAALASKTMPRLYFIGTVGLESLEEWELVGGIEGGL